MSLVICRARVRACWSLSIPLPLSLWVVSGNLGLALSWMDALASMIAAGYLCVFSCANDFGDVRGEVAVWRGIIGPRCVAGLRHPVP